MMIIPFVPKNIQINLVKNGAISIHEPQNMPWNQRTSLFADSDGNILEIFAQIK